MWRNFRFFLLTFIPSIWFSVVLHQGAKISEPSRHWDFERQLCDVKVGFPCRRCVREPLAPLSVSNRVRAVFWALHSKSCINYTTHFLRNQTENVRKYCYSIVYLLWFYCCCIFLGVWTVIYGIQGFSRLEVCWLSECRSHLGKYTANRGLSRMTRILRHPTCQIVASASGLKTRPTKAWKSLMSKILRTLWLIGICIRCFFMLCLT